ncbi:hypothetical protein D1013_11690 [Euzebyella marina]|uniref:Lipoprotein n=1 Tax=Euzebyella marina TaxID=1761453 RepID=A0A3G2L733_9FLAO|nr:DUF6146 family protein [Euzebyella marina]AYN67991.1 hypothetical protein D1013_11690 [Euzebyella marina]
MKKMMLFLGGMCFFILLITGSCTGTKQAVDVSDKEQMAFDQKVGDTVEISSDSTEYEIIIIEPGFNFWLQSIARPEGYYSQSFLENRNQIYVINYNQRVLQPMRYSPSLYEWQIDYNPNIDYGYEVNYKLYNYFIYFQRKYNQRLGPFVPRI